MAVCPQYIVHAVIDTSNVSMEGCYFFCCFWRGSAGILCSVSVRERVRERERERVRGCVRGCVREGVRGCVRESIMVSGRTRTRTRIRIVLVGEDVCFYYCSK